MSLAASLHTMACGQSLPLSLPAGAELRCISGQWHIQTAAVRGLEAASGGLCFVLRTGQSWRAPLQVQLQATAMLGPASLQYHAALPVAVVPNAWPAGWLHGWRNNWWRRLRGGQWTTQPK